MKFFSAFSGIGGFDLGFERALGDKNVEIVGISEVDKYAIKIYEKHFPNGTNYGDIRRINTRTLPDFDVFCGGFPCQDLSIAGKRAGLCGARSGLFFEIVRIIREKQPRIVFLENVKGLFSSNRGWDFARILVDLDESGYDVEWACLNSKNFGVPQNRERVFIIGHLRRQSWGPIFPIEENNRGVDEGAEQTANTFTAGGHSGGLHSSMTLIQVAGTNQNNRVYSPEGLSKCISNGGGLGAKTGLIITPTVRAEHHNTANVHFINQESRIRRLTPLEAERLQGFPDGWTAVGSDDKPISDTQRYRCLGNAVTVNVIEAIAKRIVMVI